MYGRHGSSSEAESIFSSVGQFVLLYAAIAFFSSACLLKQIVLPLFDHKISVDFTSLEWLAELKIGFEHIDSAKVVPLIESPKYFLAKDFSNPKVLGKVASVDRILLTEAASQRPRKKNSVSPAGSTEQRKLMLMHRFLTMRLLIALNAPGIHLADIQMNTLYTSPTVQRSFSTARLDTHSLNTHRVSVKRRVHPIGSTPKVTVLNVKPIGRKIAHQGRMTYEPVASSQGDQHAVDATISSAQEWNQLIPQEFQKIVTDYQASDLLKSGVQLAELGPQLNGLYYRVLGDHLTSLRGVAITQSILATHVIYVPKTTVAKLSSNPKVNKQVDTQIATLVERDPTENSLAPLAFRKIVAANESFNTFRSEVELSELAPQINGLYFRVLGDQIASLQGIAPHSVVVSNQVQSPVLLTAQLSPALKPNVYSTSSLTASDKIVVTQSHVAPVQVALVDSQQVADEAPPTEKKTMRVRSAPRGVTTYVEAFDINRTPILGAQTDIISTEPTEQEDMKRGWQNTSDADHWPTLHWLDPTENENEFIPLMLNNTVKSFQSQELGGIVQQAGAGIVFGKIAGRWQVEFALEDPQGRSESPIFLDLQRARVMGNDETETDRYFIFLNVNPGARIVYMNSRHGEGSAGVFIPVLADTATYLDLTQIAFRGTLSGTLFDESETADEQLWPLGGATIKVIGQSSAVATTDTNGYFQFQNLVTASSYPIFIESDKMVETDDELKKVGFTHRYRVLPQRMENLNLFRIAKPQIRQGWFKQLGKNPQGEPAVSKASGLVVATLPKFVASHPDLTLFPRVVSLLSSPSLIPETYTLSEVTGPLGVANQLQIQTPLKGDETRFIGVQVPEGPVVSKVIDTGLNVIWAELIFAAPGVVNIVGPY